MFSIFLLKLGDLENTILESSKVMINFFLDSEEHILSTKYYFMHVESFHKTFICPYEMLNLVQIKSIWCIILALNWWNFLPDIWVLLLNKHLSLTKQPYTQVCFYSSALLSTPHPSHLHYQLLTPIYCWTKQRCHVMHWIVSLEIHGSESLVLESWDLHFNEFHCCKIFHLHISWVYDILSTWPHLHHLFRNRIMSGLVLLLSSGLILSTAGDWSPNPSTSKYDLIWKYGYCKCN